VAAPVEQSLTGVITLADTDTLDLQPSRAVVQAVLTALDERLTLAGPANRITAILNGQRGSPVTRSQTRLWRRRRDGSCLPFGFPTVDEAPAAFDVERGAVSLTPMTGVVVPASCLARQRAFCLSLFSAV
jgi:hypothetical protein